MEEFSAQQAVATRSRITTISDSISRAIRNSLSRKKIVREEIVFGTTFRRDFELIEISKSQALGRKEGVIKNDFDKRMEELRFHKTGELLEDMRKEWLKDQMKKIDKKERRQIEERKFFDDNFIVIVFFLAIILLLFLSRNC
jgi:hypothetical protein